MTDLAQIAALLAQQQRQLDALVTRAASGPGPVLTLAEAIAYAKHESDSAFYRWAAKWKVRACAQGRYARGHLDRALAREAATRRLPLNPPNGRSSADKSRAGSSPQRDNKAAA